jgi:putative transposase
MKFNPDIHHRKTIRLREYDYSQAGFYFVTICTQDRIPLFGNIIDGVMVLNAAADILQTVWNEISTHYPNVILDGFVIMPNHVHGILEITHKMTPDPVGAIHELPLHEPFMPLIKQRRQMLIPKIVGRFKMLSGKAINLYRQTPSQPVWQRNYWEHIIRNELELHDTREYIRNNPAQWELDDLYM